MKPKIEEKKAEEVEAIKKVFEATKKAVEKSAEAVEKKAEAVKTVVAKEIGVKVETSQALVIITTAGIQRG